ncbi:teichoic acid ABC transporter permease [Terrilactibacillus sp. BCM23-1]|uniref:Transport permease protein n=1 Tax=Terrilactibacillus tamarindi TaxID=2599694 RepID=A0A6N8CN47_9BACI|nr:ABC transporter permease [Terrilactibacillus tamarindi]MTT30617.1 teichoic acid ABC transporter permease [Terrilactibacillus tamarindi]
MKSAFIVIREQIKSFYLIRRLSMYEMKSSNNNNYLGMLWEIINPMIQIGIYWFVFGFGIRKNHGVNMDSTTIPFLFWMLSGIVLWFFINPAIQQGSKSIYSRIRFVAKMSFPMSAIPSYVIMAKFYQHLMLTAIIIIIFQFTDFHISKYIIQLPYFMFASIVFVLAVSLVTSTLSTIVRDVHQIVQAIMRMMIYLVPFLWVIHDNSEGGRLILKIMKFNPLYYLVEGYRSSILGTSWYPIVHFKYSLYFWGVVAIIFMFGSMIHLKFRDRFVDYL